MTKLKLETKVLGICMMSVQICDLTLYWNKQQQGILWKNSKLESKKLEMWTSVHRQEKYYTNNKLEDWQKNIVNLIPYHYKWELPRNSTNGAFSFSGKNLYDQPLVFPSIHLDQITKYKDGSWCDEFGELWIQKWRLPGWKWCTLKNIYINTVYGGMTGRESQLQLWTVVHHMNVCIYI